MLLIQVSTGLGDSPVARLRCPHRRTKLCIIAPCRIFKQFVRVGKYSSWKSWKILVSVFFVGKESKKFLKNYLIIFRIYHKHYMNMHSVNSRTQKHGPHKDNGNIGLGGFDILFSPSCQNSPCFPAPEKFNRCTCLYPGFTILLNIQAILDKGYFMRLC